MQHPPVILTRHTGKSYAILRIIVGLLFACHGAQKLFGVLGGTLAIHRPLGLAAGLIEFGAGVLVALGLLGRAAAFLASGEMAVAYFMACAGRGFWPIANGGETAVLYCFVFLYIVFHGSGSWSLDSFRHGSHERPNQPMQRTSGSRGSSLP
jgi:putative oxidoreductase